MRTETISIEVSPEVAQAFRNASPEEQERVRERAREVFRVGLLSREEAAEEFRRLTREMSAYAAEQGLTPEKLDALLSEEDAD